MDQHAKQVTINLRRDAKAAHTKSVNRIKQVLRRHNLQHDMPTRTFPTKAAIAWLKAIQLPAADMLELRLAMENLELQCQRVAQLDGAIAEIPVNTGSSDGALIGVPGEARKSEILHGVWTNWIQRAVSNHQTAGPTKKCLGVFANSDPRSRQRLEFTIHDETNRPNKSNSTDEHTNLKFQPIGNCARRTQSQEWNPKQLDNCFRNVLLGGPLCL